MCYKSLKAVQDAPLRNRLRQLSVPTINYGTYAWLGEDDTFSGEDVIPGFTLKLRDIL